MTKIKNNFKEKLFQKILKRRLHGRASQDKEKSI